MSFAPFAVLVDAEIELGRYGAAERTLQRMVDFKPSLASYARVSYYRELHGDLVGAVDALRLAEAATPVPGRDRSYIQTLIGDLEFQRGRLERRPLSIGLLCRGSPATRRPTPASPRWRRPGGNRSRRSIAFVVCWSDVPVAPST